jgi:hypothetical protein
MKKYVWLFPLFLFGFTIVFAQSPPNGGFEDWSLDDVFNIEEPVGWVTSNLANAAGGFPANVTKTNDAYSGNYAMKMETIEDPSANPIGAGAVCMADINFTPEKLVGYYKAELNGNDVAGMSIILLADGVGIGGGEIEFETNQSNYTAFEIIIEYFIPNVVPTDLTMTILNSTSDPTVVGTTFYVDGLSLGDPSGVFVPFFPEVKARISPNPATDLLNVEVPDGFQNLQFRLMDLSGRVWTETTFNKATNLNVSHLTSGYYFYELRNEKGVLLDGGKIQIQ